MKESLLAQKRAVESAQARFEAAVANDLRNLHLEFGFESTNALIAALSKLNNRAPAPTPASAKAPAVKAKPVTKPAATPKPATKSAATKGRKKRKKITPEMRDRAVKLLADKVSYGKIAAELGISEQSVYNIRVASRAAAKKSAKPAAAKVAPKKSRKKATAKSGKKSATKKGAKKPVPAEAAKPATEKTAA